MNVVLNRTVVVDGEYESLSTTTVLFRTAFTRKIKLNLLLPNILANHFLFIYYKYIILARVGL